MKTALLTMALTPDYLQWGNALTFPRMRDYADKFGLDFILINKCKRDLALGDVFDWERNDALYDVLEHYDRVIHLDTDVIVRQNAEDISGLPYDIFYGFDNAPYNPEEVVRCQKQTNQTWTDLARRLPLLHLYNAGMFVCDQSHRGLFAPIQPEPYNRNADQSRPSHWKGQGLLAARLHAYDIPTEHREDLFGFSYLEPRPFPSFLHVLWNKEPKAQAVEFFIKEMDNCAS